MTEGKQLPATQQKQLPMQQSAPQSNPLAWLTPENERFCKFAVESGYFQQAGITNMAQAVMKVAFGQELNISPTRALNELYVVRGKVQMEPNAIATAFANHDRYDLDLLEVDDNHATVQVKYDGKPKGKPVTFTYQQAVEGKFNVDKDGRPKIAWKVDRHQQLFYKAAARAQRLWARDLFKVTVYDTDEHIDEPPSDYDVQINDPATQAVAQASLSAEQRAKQRELGMMPDVRTQQPTQTTRADEAPTSTSVANEQAEDASIVSEATTGSETISNDGSSQGTPSRSTSAEDMNRKLTQQEANQLKLHAMSFGYTETQLKVKAKKNLTDMTVSEAENWKVWLEQNPKQ